MQPSAVALPMEQPAGSPSPIESVKAAVACRCFRKCSCCSRQMTGPAAALGWPRPAKLVLVANFTRDLPSWPLCPTMAGAWGMRPQAALLMQMV